MTTTAKIRSALFAGGAAGVLLSISILITGFFRSFRTTDYLEQSREAIPFIRWGLGSATAGLLLCCFGTRWLRIAGLSAAFLLSLWWFFIAESIL